MVARLLPYPPFLGSCSRVRRLSSGLQPELRHRISTLLQRYEVLQKQVTIESFSAARMKELARLGAVAEAHSQLQAKEREVVELHELADDQGAESELRALARTELLECQADVVGHKERLLSLMVPPDPSDERAVVLEVRAGVGGIEAPRLFASELFEMYGKLARRRRWQDS